MQPPLRALVARRREQRADRTAGEDESRPRKQRKDGQVAGRSHVPLQPDREARRPAATRARLASAGRSQQRRRRTTQRDAARGPAGDPRAGRRATIAGPMMFRMSTRNSVTGVTARVTMNPCRRNRKARMKISRPRRQAISTPRARPLLRRAARCRSGRSARPRRRQHDGESRQPQKERRRKAAEDRGVAIRDAMTSAARVHASIVCARS